MIPDSLLQSLHSARGFDPFNFLEAHKKIAPTSIRLNPVKTNSEIQLNEKVAWSVQSYYLNERPNFTIDPFFHAGNYYVQEASSIFLEHVVRYLKTNTAFNLALDACAAPGGKSTILLDTLSSNTFLVSNEIISSRANILIDNLTKWGNKNNLVTNNDTSKFKALEGVFDLILIDAPCSGSGLFRKDNEAIKEWSLQAVDQCADRQEKILANLVGCIANNGYLIYSTCSYSEKENEEICDYIMENYQLNSIQIPHEKSWGIVEVQSEKQRAYAYRFYPDKVKGEGFFIAIFKQEKEVKSGLHKHKGTKNFSVFQKSIATDFIQAAPTEVLVSRNNFLHCIERTHLELAEALSSTLNIRKLGVEIGELKGNNLVPSHALAMSTILINSKIPRIELSLDTALKYLRGENIQVENSATGWAIVCYKNHPLGWIKLIQNRTNNYYPKYSRIVHY